jgi:hypothetical protein
MGSPPDRDREGWFFSPLALDHAEARHRATLRSRCGRLSGHVSFAEHPTKTGKRIFTCLVGVKASRRRRPEHQPGRKMQMTFDRNACKRNARLAAAVLAASVMTSAFADARPIHYRPAHYLYLFPCAAIDRIGDGPFQYRGNCDGPMFTSYRSRHLHRHHPPKPTIE